MTAKQAAQVIGCTKRHVLTLINQNKLKATKKTDEHGRPYYIITEVEALRYKNLPQTIGWPRGQSRT